MRQSTLSEKILFKNYEMTTKNFDPQMQYFLSMRNMKKQETKDYKKVAYAISKKG